MKMEKSKLLKTCLNKWRKMEYRAAATTSSSSLVCDSCCEWAFWPLNEEDRFIPRDVPRGHVAVYVGDNCTRFVIKIALLGHPLFKALLEQAREEYDFTANSKLCIPCDENMFIDVVRCATSPHDNGVFLCF